jgi:WS/DGAT/MGAT family acyltransferase
MESEMPSSHSSDRLSAGDAAFLYLEKPEMPLHIGSVSIFEGVISVNSLAALIESKLPLIPRYRQRIVAPWFDLGHPTWEFDPDFDIRRHIRRVTLEQGTDGELQVLAGQIFSQVMPRDRPLWDVTLVSGLKSGGTGVIARVHHCLVDGVSGIGLLQLVLDSQRKSARPPKAEPFHAPPLPGATESFLDALISTPFEALDGVLGIQSAFLDVAQALVGNQALAALSTLAGLVPDLATSLDRYPFNAPCRGPRQHAWTEIRISEINAIREVCGATLNDVALAVVVAAVRKYAQWHGQTVRNRLVRIMVPVNLRSPGELVGVGNRISALPFLAPLDINKPVELLRAVHARAQGLKRSHVLELMGVGAAWMGAITPPFQALLGRLGNVLPIPPFHLVCTNVPGPQYPLFLLGHRMLASYPYVPVGNDMGFCCALQSYDGRLWVGLTADSEAMPDVGRMREFVDQSFQELREAAGVSPVRSEQSRKKRPAAPKVSGVPVRKVAGAAARSIEAPARQKTLVAAKPAGITERERLPAIRPRVPAREEPALAVRAPEVAPLKEPDVIVKSKRKPERPAASPATETLPLAFSEPEAGPEMAEDIEAEPTSVN